MLNMDGYYNEAYTGSVNDIKDVATANGIATGPQNDVVSDVIRQPTNGHTRLESDVANDVMNKPTNGDVVSGSSGSVTTEDFADPELRCGLGSCKPDCLQSFNNPKALLAWLCWFSFLQGFMINGINNVNTTTLERRFELSSSQAGMISSSYDISAAVFAIPISFYGQRGHQPRMLTMAALSMTCGAFIMSIPHFATGPYDLRESQSDECILGFNATQTCDPLKAPSRMSMWLGVLILGMIFNGIGGTTLYSVGVVFLDTNVSTKNSPLYQGFLYSSATLGPALGYVLGGYFIDFYVDFEQVESGSIHIGPDDPRFVGAWWIGLLCSGVLLFTVVLLLMCYPRELPAAKRVRAKKIIETHQTELNKAANQEGFGKRWKDLPAATKILVSNPVYMLITFAGVSESLVVSGMAAFLSKLVQNQFSQTAVFAAILAGVVAVPGAAGGQFVGGLICKLGKFNIKKIIKFNTCCLAMAALMCAVLFIRCPSPSFAGINVEYSATNISSRNANLLASCNEFCHCTELSYEPICGINNIQYFSACHAGCQKTSINGSKTFIDCKCIDAPVQNRQKDAMAVLGICESDCILLWVFVPTFFILVFLLFITIVPSITTIMRCVPESQRSFAMGLQWVFLRIFGSIPGPIMMGAVFDSTCTVWQETCDGRGSCWIYDGASLSLRLFILGFVFRLISAALFLSAFIIYKPPGEHKHDKVDDSVDIDSEEKVKTIDDDEIDNTKDIETIANHEHINLGADLEENWDEDKHVYSIHL